MTWGFVAVGAGTLIGGALSAKGSRDAASSAAGAADRAAQLEYEQYLQSRQDLSPYRQVATGDEILDPDGNVIGYTGGALNTLAGYGPSRVDPSGFLPQTEIPWWQGSQVGELPDVQGQIPEFDSTQFDIYKDPSYDWRVEEQMRGIDRGAAASGQVASGNRLEALMKRSGEMASQEYGAARDRMLQDYGIDRSNALTQYGFDVDAYNRALGLDQEQYGRDLTTYNADLAREQGMYNRGLGEYGLYSGIEGDYLNRLASLSNIGQTATNRTGALGAMSAQGQANQIANAGAYQAGGQLGQANAWGSVVGQLGNLGGQYFQSQQMPYTPNSYNPAGGNYSPVPQQPIPYW